MRTRSSLASLFALISVFVFACAASADFWTDEGNYDLSWFDNAAPGTGDTPESPYLISTPAELAGLSYMMKKENISKFSKIDEHRFYEKYVALANDIDLSAHEWLPIGSWQYTTAYTPAAMIHFSGSFDGRGHKITGLRIETLKADVAPYSDCGIGLFAHPGYKEKNTTAEVKNLYIEGKIVPQGGSATAKWPYAGLLGGSSAFMAYTNVVGVGEVTSNAVANNNGDAGILIGTMRGGSFNNCVVYGKTRSTVRTTVGSLAGRAGQNSGTTPYSQQGGFGVDYFNNVTLMTSVTGTSGQTESVGSGMASAGGVVVKTASNNAFLSNAENKITKACHNNNTYFTKFEEARPISSEGDVKVTAVMLPSEFLRAEHNSAADVEVPLEFYPAGAKSEDVTAEWTFEDEGVTVKRTNRGFATVNSSTRGTKKFTVVVRGLNGFKPGDSVTLRGEITFAGAQSGEDDPSDIEPQIAPSTSDVKLEGASINGEIKVQNAPNGIAAVEKGKKSAEEVISGTLDGQDGSRISSVTGFKIHTTIEIDVEHGQSGGEQADLPITIENYTKAPSDGTAIYLLVKENKDGAKYDMFRAELSGTTLKAVIKNFAKYFTVNRIVIAEAAVSTEGGTHSSSGGSCAAGAAAVSAAALITVRRKKK